MALQKAVEILENPNSKKEWQEKQKKLWSDVIDVTSWLTDFIERYPESFYEYKRENRTSK
jgi:predicted glycosyltransferase